MKHRAGEDEATSGPSEGKRRYGLFAVTFQVVLLSVMWVSFSGHLDPLHLAYGALSVVGVLALTGRLVGARSEVARSDVLVRIRWHRMVAYPFWLLWRIAVANLQVARAILHPRMPIDPCLMTFDSGLERELSQVTLGNSITLTPGTLTMHVRGRVFLVHALSKESCDGIVDGSMPGAVARLFDEPVPTELNARFSRNLGDLEIQA